METAEAEKALEQKEIEGLDEISIKENLLDQKTEIELI